ncbi:MAG: AAA family ATPase [Chitinophagaceae bacterium]
MNKLIGRQEEKKILENALSSKTAELVAIYGRRRVGKTYLIRSVYEKQIVFEFTGVKNAKLTEQLANFSRSLKTGMGISSELKVPGNWQTAFYDLQRFLEPIVNKRKAVIFFDEFPWINTPRSNFLRSFEYFWNTWASKFPNITVVICGSAASWMIQHIVKNKGGLHNRVSVRMKLSPFTLQETELYLKSRSVKLDRYQILNLYMVMGGIPQYLSNIQPGESAAQAIDRICFTDHGYLKDEFDNLYSSLFDYSTNHIAIVKSLSKKNKGLTRSEIIEEAGLSSGGTASTVLEELQESGFVSTYLPFDKTAKDVVYRLTDEYSLFYLKFMSNRKMIGKGSWLRIKEQQTWSSWSGYSFEAICMKHQIQIKRALGIDTTYVEASVWGYVSKNGQKGAQIDLLLDRDDRCINICEMKFSNIAYTISKKYAEELERKRDVFIERTKTRKTVFITMVTTFGVVKNNYYNKVVQSELSMDDLFR